MAAAVSLDLFGITCPFRDNIALTVNNSTVTALRFYLSSKM